MDSNYDRRLDETWAIQHVQSLLDLGHTDFNALLKQAWGMSPFVIKRVLDELGVPTVFGESYSSNGASKPDHADRLPIQHPLDCSWRFTRESSIQLLNYSVRQFDSPTLLIGCPSIAVNAAKAHTDCGITLVDIDGWTLDEVNKIAPEINCIELDVFAERIPGGLYTTVILDPPWYPVEMNAFIVAASQAVDHNGTVVVVIPPKGVRRSAEYEIQTMIADAVKSGLNLCDYLHGSVNYYMPFFERQALRAANLGQVHPEWRQGDLLVFRRSDKSVEHASPQQAQPYSQWSELKLESSRVRFASQPTHGATSELESILPGNILPDISRRSPYVARASVWTSGNRIFASSDPDSLRLALSCIIDGKPLEARPSLAHAAQELYHIMLLEMEEVAAQ